MGKIRNKIDKEKKQERKKNPFGTYPKEPARRFLASMLPVKTSQEEVSNFL